MGEEKRLKTAPEEITDGFIQTLPDSHSRKDLETIEVQPPRAQVHEQPPRECPRA